MQGKKVYIQNTYTSDIQIDVKKDGRFRKTFVFARFVTDKYTGMVASDGYTELSAEDYALLKDDRAFKYAIDKGAKGKYSAFRHYGHRQYRWRCRSDSAWRSGRSVLDVGVGHFLHDHKICRNCTCRTLS